MLCSDSGKRTAFIVPTRNALLINGAKFGNHKPKQKFVSPRGKTFASANLLSIMSCRCLDWRSEVVSGDQTGVESRTIESSDSNHTATQLRNLPYSNPLVPNRTHLPRKLRAILNVGEHNLSVTLSKSESRLNSGFGRSILHVRRFRYRVVALPMAVRCDAD